MNIKASLEKSLPVSQPLNENQRATTENKNKRALKSIAKSIEDNDFSQIDAFDDNFENVTCKFNSNLC